MTPRRYQLRKDAVAIVLREHPWIFRDQLSSAAGVFGDGDWLRLVDGQNCVIGYGVFEAEGAIAIRILRRGEHRPDAAWFTAQLAKALARRALLSARTDAIRLVQGESDGIPAVVIDRFGDTSSRPAIPPAPTHSRATCSAAVRARARWRTCAKSVLRPARGARATPCLRACCEATPASSTSSRMGSVRRRSCRRPEDRHVSRSERAASRDRDGAARRQPC
ncbi:MAG: hypothetical protein WKG01_17995 [Kofleriaceae bacterium]